MATIKELGDNGPDGTRLGQTASSLVAFHGASPVIQRTNAAQAAVGTSVPISATPYGFTVTQATAIIALVNELRAAMVEKGLILGS